MGWYLLRRTLLMLPTLFGISLLCFLLMQAVPGGPVEEYLAKIKAVSSDMGQNQKAQVTAAEMAHLKAYFGFDKPMHERYLTWLLKLLKLDLGISYAYQKPVLDVLYERLPISLFFGLVSFFLSYLI